MHQLPSISKIKKYFPSHRICLQKTLLLLMSCILISESVNLNKCKKVAPKLSGDKGLNISNVYTRFIRFFKMKEISVFCICLAGLCLESVRKMKRNTYILIDRTNWKLGGQNLNILQVGLTLSNGLMIPVFGVPLNKRGNSNEKERTRLLNIVLRLCGSLGKGDILLGDREFIGKKWFADILGHGLSFVIRCRKDDYLSDIAISNGVTVDKLTRKIKRKVKRDGFYFTKLWMCGRDLYYVVVKEEKKASRKQDGYVRLLSDLADSEVIREAYRRRWEIEVYFAATKRKGFNLEDIGLKDLDKVMLMVTIVGYLYTLTLSKGMESSEGKPPDMQYHANRDRSYRRVSVFTKGLEELHSIIFLVGDMVRLIKRGISGKPPQNHQLIREFKGRSIVEHLKSV